MFSHDLLHTYLSGHFSQKQAKMKVVKIKNPDFSYWARMPHNFFTLFDIWWSSLDIIIDF